MKAVSQPNAGPECKYSSTNLPFGVQVHPLSLSPPLLAHFLHALLALSPLFHFPSFPLGVSSCLCLSVSLKDQALLCSSLWGRVRVCCFGVSLNRLLRAQAAELQPSTHCKSSARLAQHIHAHKCFAVSFLMRIPDNMQGNQASLMGR